MDPRERADAALARARARGPFVVTPESAISPMDAANTLQLPRIVIAENDDRRDPDATLVVPLSDLRPGDNVPAIAQEALTDVVGSPPGIRSRQRRIEDAIARGAAVRQQQAEAADAQPAADQQQAQPAPQTQPTHVPQAQPQVPQAPPVQLPAEPDNAAGGAPAAPEPPTGSLSQRLDG